MSQNIYLKQLYCWELRSWLPYFPIGRIYLISEEAKKKDAPLDTSGMR